MEYKNTKVYSNTDGLSRHPLEEKSETKKGAPVVVFNLMQFDPLPVSVSNIPEETQRDPFLARVYEMTSKGWPYNQNPKLNLFFTRRDEIILQSGCLM